MRSIKVRTIVLAALLGLSAPTGCASPPEPPSLPPDRVYAHAAADEDSRAVPVPAGGTAAALTRPLTRAGWFCAQVRSNADGRALWCRIGHRDETGGVRPQVAQFLLDRQDRLAWAWFPAPEDGTYQRAEPPKVADAAAPALDAVWPGAGDRVRREIDAFARDQPDPVVWDDGAPRTSWRDEHADYGFSDLDGLLVTAAGAAVRRWPFGAEHYATTMSSAVDDLKAGGYDCFYPPQQSCTRVRSNGYFRVTLRGDQIVTARFGIGSSIQAGRQRHPLTEEFPRGLTFLSEAVRGPVTARIERARRSGTGFTGIVAGTIVVIDADLGRVHAGDLVAYFDIQVGAPLAATLAA
ncbi:hypothetical protein ACU635_26025 [[Actinomadura] parvosata]|uniref:hypothetical protein n=1 Tax=[Actinomadura] parvosata TaxID=1955412 RepID=UPI00406C079D